MAGANALSQLRAILTKNLLLKLAKKWSSLAEIALPVLFMALLILIKSITTLYDSPNVAYSCGQTFPWYGTETVGMEVPELTECGVKPATCNAKNYYRNGMKAGTDYKIFSELGYVSSSWKYPFFSYAVQDNTSFVNGEDSWYYNPSLPFADIIDRLANSRALLAVTSTSSSLSGDVNTLATYLQGLANPESAFAIKTFPSEKKLENYITNQKYEDKDYGDGKVWGALVLKATADQQWMYKIRLNFTYDWEGMDGMVGCLYGDDCEQTFSVPDTRESTNDLDKPYEMSAIYGYGYSGFLTLQQVMDKYIILTDTGSNVDVTASISMMPTNEYISDDFQMVISSVLGIFYILSYLYPVAQMVRGLVLDKEERLKEGMKMMGLSEFAYNASWLITLTIQLTVVSALITAVTSDSVFEYSDKSYVFLFFFAFSIAIMCFCFLLASIFQKAKTAALLGPLLFFATFFPSYAVADDNFSTETKTWACLLAPTCFALGANVFAEFEGGLVGIQESNVDDEVGNLSYNLVVGMLFVDAAVYGVLAWYLDKVFPSEYGTPLPLYFPFTKSYWFGTPVGEAITDGDIEDNTPNLEPVAHEYRRQIEEQKCVQVRGLRKVFQTTGEDRIAVKNLNMEMYEGQITVLLGHNGAGKSTTISMLSGLISPTAGDAIIRGRSINTDMKAVRAGLGVCPQHNVLFPELTVMQHLRMYAIFKGVPSNEVDQQARTMIAEVGLLEKANVPSGMLSGGMKRKLSLGIALIGDSKVVILDEPTSGMDPYSRRSTWNVLQRNKRGRVILLTTHFMDEADYLGDRIAIMAAGQLKCFGSSLYLKGKYGVGYTLTIVRKEGPNHTAEIEKVVMSHVPTAEILSNVGAEFSFRLPFAASSSFTEMFAELDGRKQELNFAQYGISVTTLEEVFMRVGHEAHEEEAHKKQAAQEHKGKSNGTSNREVSPKSIEPLGIDESNGHSNGNGSPKDGRGSNAFWSGKKGRESELKVFLTHFMALLRKRAIYGMRDRKMLICQLVLPTILVATGLGLLQIVPAYELPNMRLAPYRQNPDLSKSYRDPVPFYSMNSFGEDMAATFNSVQSYGYAVEVEDYPDQFDGCHQGAVPLQDMSNFLIATRKTKDERGASRYGAVTVSNTTDATRLEYNVMVNGSSVHGAGIYPNMVHQAALQMLTGNPNARITAYSHPLPRTYRQEREEASMSAFTVSLFMMIAFCFIPASYAMFVVKEREVKAKHQQIISGVSIPAYWASTFTWDAVSYLFPLGVVMILIAAFDVKAYIKGDAAGATFLTIFLYGPSTAAFTYMISFLFSSHSTAQNIVMFFNFITGLCLMVVSFVLSSIPSTTEIAYSLRFLFRLFPAYCLGDGLMQLTMCQDGECARLTEDGYDFAQMVGVFHWDVVTGNLVYMAVGTVVYFGIVLLIEYMLTFPRILAWLQYTPDPGYKDETEDDDVAAERQRVARGDADGEVVRIDSLRKVYPSSLGPKVAVQSLSFGIPKGECFGFLGINGAGKTTTLSILSGEFPPTSGAAFIAGFDILQDQSKIRRKIGYCPQFDALLELLTVREHLQLYARIKGIPEDILEDVVEQKIQQMDLTDFANKAAGSLSGGNKRKLSVAIAIIGEPSIVFLDEPSTGMDPVARRFMWDVIAQISTRDRSTSIILTTHSMEEAEALCARIGIMVNGRLSCLGSSTHLKNKFGSGYEVDIRTRLASTEEMLKMATALTQAGVIQVAAGADPLKAEVQAPFDTLATVLGKASRASEIAPGGSGALLYDALMADGHLKVQSILEWWLAEDFANDVDSFINSEFDPQTVMLVERSTGHSFRYRINDLSLSLSQMFGKFEAGKVDANIESYSLGQTTLEQIFNQFAGSQENPEVAALSK